MRSTPRADRRRAPARAGARVGLLLLLWLPLSGAARAAADPGYLDELLRRADALELAAAEEWQALLHYRGRGPRGGLRSQVDDARFFLAAEGAHDPRAELEATLRAFFVPESTRDDGQHPQCAFIARYRFLKRRLDFAPSRLPERPCPRYQEARSALGEVRGLTLVFAEAFLNNPASMFGHTLLRLDTEQSRGSGDMLAWAINFAGATGNEVGPLYAIKGIFGLYPGYYSIAPYYQKVKEYGDWENRDIWEYRLRLSPAEIERLLLHLWEMQELALDYYYFDENCSYQLLALLQTARPELRLTDGFPLWVIPVDTVRAVVGEAGLLQDWSYRPSAATRLRHEAAQLSRSSLRLARRISSGRLEPEDPILSELDEPERAAVLSVAYDHLRYRYLAGDVERDASADLSRRILVARSRVAFQGSTAAPPAAPALRPDQGHASARAALEAGWQDDRSYLELRLRPAFHDLLDAEGGYTPGAEIRFLDLALRWYPEDGELRFQEAVLLDIVSLAPWGGLLRPLSWRFDTGLRTRLVSDGGRRRDPQPVWRTRSGAGLATGLGKRALVYALAEITLDVGPALQHDVALGGGASAGLFVGSSEDRWKAQLCVRAIRFAAGDRSTMLRAGLEQRLRLSRNTALRIDGSFNRDFGESWAEAGLRFDVHF